MKKETKPKAKTTKATKATKAKETIDITVDDNTQTKIESFGLGDTIEKITSVLGIKKCEACEQKRKKLNKFFPWLTKENLPELSPEEIELVLRVRETPQSVANDDVNLLFETYNRIFSPTRKLKKCQCSGLLRMIIERLELMVPETE